MDSENKTRQSVIVLCCCIVCVITAVVCAVLFLSAKQKNDDKITRDKVVVSLGEDKISESQFEFFARLILNQEESTVKELYTSKDKSDKDELKKYTSNFINEYLVRVNEAEKAGVSLTEQEQESLNKQFEEDYEKNKKTDEGELSKEDLLISPISKEGFVSESDGTFTVVLVTELTPELLELGLVREFVSKVQQTRKDNGYEVVDHIKIYVNAGSETNAVLTKFKKDICADTLADDMFVGEVKGGLNVELNGEEICLKLEKV